MKVENCLIDSNGSIKICDFGLAVTKDTIKQMSEPSRSQAASQGTLGYIAPERICEGKISDASDVYSFGIVTAYMLFVKFPWVDGNGTTITTTITIITTIINTITITDITTNNTGRVLDDIRISTMITAGQLPECFSGLSSGIIYTTTVL